MDEAESVNVGSSLRRRRQELNLSVEEVARETKIRKTYILAIEEERFEELPGKVYIVGFLQNYARFLGIPSHPLIQAFNGMPEPSPGLNASQPQLRSTTMTGRRRSPFKKIMVGGILAVVIGGLVFYSPEITDMFGPSASWQVPGVENEKSPDSPSEPSATEAMPAAEAGPGFSEKELEGQVASKAHLPRIPAGGGTLKIISQGEGQFQIAIDGGNFRKYLAQPGLTLSWQVQEKTDLKLDVEGSVIVMVDDQEYLAPGQGQLSLTMAPAQEE